MTVYINWFSNLNDVMWWYWITRILKAKTSQWSRNEEALMRLTFEKALQQKKWTDLIILFHFIYRYSKIDVRKTLHFLVSIFRWTLATWTYASLRELPFFMANVESFWVKSFRYKVIGWNKYLNQMCSWIVVVTWNHFVWACLFFDLSRIGLQPLNRIFHV